MDYYSLFIFVILLAWIYILFFYGRKFNSKEGFFWSSNIVFEKLLLKRDDDKFVDKKKVCVVIPARNEENVISDTLLSIVKQNDIFLDILLIDDNSTDKTINKAKQVFLKEKFKDFKILQGKKLPVGWSGKVWALYQGVEYLKKSNHDYLVFLDSDIRLEEKTLINTISFLENEKLKMLSLMAKLNCSTIWEKLLIPSFIYFFQKLYPFNLVNNPKKKIAAAAGGFILCKKEVFINDNMYIKIKDKVIDDCNLANLIKKKGGIWLGLTNLATSQRKYYKLNDIWRMVSRTAFEQLNYSVIMLSISVFGLFSLYIFPIINLFFLDIKKDGLIYLTNLIIFIMTTSAFIPTIKFYNLKLIYIFTLPFSACLYTLMTLSSAYNFFFKDGNTWKGRKY